MPTIMAQAELPKQGAIAPTETAPVTEPAPELSEKPPEQDQTTSKFAALAKKERWIKKMLDDVNKQKKDIEAKEAEYKTKYVDKQRIKDNFLDVAMEAGLTPDQIANMLLQQPQANDPNAQVIKELRSELMALKQEMQETKTGWQDKEKTQYDQAVAQIKRDADTLLSSDTGTYETLKTKTNASELITQYIEETYKEEGTVLKVDEAASFIENELMEQAVAMASLKKVQDKLGLTKAQVEPPKQTKPLMQQHKTLTNAMSPSSNKLSARDRYKRAIMVAQGLNPDAAST